MDDCVPNPSAAPGPRRYPRYPADIRVSVEVFRPNGSASMWGRSTELGEDGVGATLTGEVEPGEVVSMELSLPAVQAPVRVRALARYRDGLRHGFEFLALNEEQRELLHRVCASLGS
ncbi:MAG: PilZ domain-containing protein [Terriglobales bacterium]